MRWGRTIGLCAAVALAACRSDEPLGPPDSFRLFTAVGPTQRPVTARPLHATSAAAAPLVKHLANGFGDEMVRTLYLAKQLIRETEVAGRRFPGARSPAVTEPLCVLTGLDRVPYGRGLAIETWWGGRLERPELTWLGLSEEILRDRAAAQIVAGRLALYTVELVTTGGTHSSEGARPSVLGDGYRMAIEVIAREWRVGQGPAGVVPHDAGSEAQRALFAGVRENGFVTSATGDVRPARELLADPGVAATVVYRMAQSPEIARRAAPEAFYAPWTRSRLPAGVTPAAVLGAFRNFQAKLLGSWGRAVLANRAPADIVDLIEVYVTAFPEERGVVTRLFLVTTLGATARVGGVSSRPADPARAKIALDDLLAEVLAGRGSLRGAMGDGAAPRK